jgi:hypothetical protein
VNNTFLHSPKVIIYTDAISAKKEWAIDDGRGKRIKVCYAGQWSLVDGVPTPK